MSDDRPSDQSDYRSSHLNRGKNYDGTIAAAPFDAYMAELERAHLGEIIPALFPDGIPRYIDFACGTARITETVAPLAKQAIGVDISASMLETARKKCPNVEFIHADLTESAQDLGQFDLATSFRFFGNAQPALRHKVLQTLARLVRPGGYLIINNHRNPHSLAALLHRATGGQMDMDLTYFRFRRILAEHGFKIIESRPIGTWLFRSGMMARLGRPDRKSLAREKLFGHRMLSAIAPDTILVTQRVA
jgi:SAM-dependent methyltransferase